MQVQGYKCINWQYDGAKGAAPPLYNEGTGLKSKKLDELAAQSNSERKRTQIKTKHLKMAALEQQSAEENVLKLVKKHKRKKQSALDKILKLKQQLNVKAEA